jgi:hypothetical protein
MMSEKNILWATPERIRQISAIQKFYTSIGRPIPSFADTLKLIGEEQ